MFQRRFIYHLATLILLAMGLATQPKHTARPFTQINPSMPFANHVKQSPFKHRVPGKKATAKLSPKLLLGGLLICVFIVGSIWIATTSNTSKKKPMGQIPNTQPLQPDLSIFNNKKVTLCKPNLIDKGANEPKGQIVITELDPPNTTIGYKEGDGYQYRIKPYANHLILIHKPNGEGSVDGSIWTTESQENDPFLVTQQQWDPETEMLNQLPKNISLDEVVVYLPKGSSPLGAYANPVNEFLKEKVQQIFVGDTQGVVQQFNKDVGEDYNNIAPLPSPPPAPSVPPIFPKQPKESEESKDKDVEAQTEESEDFKAEEEGGGGFERLKAFTQQVEIEEEPHPAAQSG